MATNPQWGAYSAPPYLLMLELLPKSLRITSEKIIRTLRVYNRYSYELFVKYIIRAFPTFFSFFSRKKATKKFAFVSFCLSFCEPPQCHFSVPLEIHLQKFIAFIKSLCTIWPINIKKTYLRSLFRWCSHSDLRYDFLIKQLFITRGDIE